MTLEEKKAAAYAAGYAAGQNGGSIAPATSPEVRKLLQGMPVGTGALQIMGQYQQGFIDAPLPK